MTEFSTEARQLLIASGWHENRCIDLSEYERALAVSGQEPCAAVNDFLSCYGDLEIDTVIGDMGLNTLFREILPRPVMLRFGEQFRTKLYTIGSCCIDCMTLLMDSSGNVYRNMRMSPQNFGGIDLYRIAASGAEALERLIVDDICDDRITGEWMAHWD